MHEWKHNVGYISYTYGDVLLKTSEVWIVELVFTRRWVDKIVVLPSFGHRHCLLLTHTEWLNGRRRSFQSVSFKLASNNPNSGFEKELSGETPYFLFIQVTRLRRCDWSTEDQWAWTPGSPSESCSELTFYFNPMMFLLHQSVLMNLGEQHYADICTPGAKI